MSKPADWEQMPYFLAVARSGSLRAAAEAMGTSHVKVNRRLNALEAAYGVALVRRSRQGVELTPAGEHLLPMAEEAEITFLHARRSLQGLDQQMQGDIRFSVSGPIAYYLMAPILATFSKLNPKINLRIHVSTQLEDPKLAETDVSLRMIYEVNDDAILKKLFSIGIGTYAHKDYLAEQLPKSGSRGEGLLWIGAGTERKPQWVSDSPFPNANLQHVLGDPLMYLELVATGLGMARFASFLTHKRPELQMVPGTTIEDGPPLCILIHPEMKRVTRIRRFVDYLERELRKMRADIQGRSKEPI